MSRPLRIEHAGGWYHLTARGNERRAIFRDNQDRAHFCQLLGQMVELFRVRLHAFVLMDNHYHLLLELTSKGDVAVHRFNQARQESEASTLR